MLCYQGKVLNNYKGSVKPDVPYCSLLIYTTKGTQSDFFYCLFDLAKLPREKKYCDMFYPYNGVQSNSTEGIKIVNARYNCYINNLFKGVDRNYCNLISSTEGEFYECLNKYKINNKADYCIWTEK